MDKIQEQADKLRKKILPYITNSTFGSGDSGDVKPPATSPPSPAAGVKPSQPPSAAPSPPTNATPPQNPPSPSPPSPTPSPPQPPSENSPRESPPPPPSTVTQPHATPDDDPQPNPVSNSNSPFSPPPPVNSGDGGSPQLSSPQTANQPRQTFQPPDYWSSGRQNPQLLPPFSPSPPSTSGSKNNPGSSNLSNGNNIKGQADGPNYDHKTFIGIGIAGALVITFIAIIFFVSRRNRKRVAQQPKQHYVPAATVAVKSDGYNYYGAKAGKGSNSGQDSSGDSQRPERTTDSGVIGTSKTLFTYEELSQITNGFAKYNVVGEGGFGCVYKGVFPDGVNVAIKQLKSSNAEGYREFKAEVEIISRVHHRHLVSLVGYCISEQHRFLIYEFVPNNTLDHHLHGRDLPVLDWAKRVKIAIGAAKGLAYLHEYCHPKIIHRDIKSSNILLDDEFEAQVADFGLARLIDSARSHISTRVMGTFGYLAPEYASSGKLTDRSDVFSFGVVLLELITGRRSVDTTQPLGEESLVEWARPLLLEAIETGDVSKLIDQRLESDYVEIEVYKMIETAASCVRHSAPKRPRMVQVVRALDNKQELSDLTNGVKVGQSTVYNSALYSQEIRNFRKQSFNSSLNSEELSDFGTSGDYTSHELESRSLNTSQTR